MTRTEQTQTGCFITLEGSEGVGKSTNLAFIQQFVDARLFVTESDLGANELTYNTSAPDD